ncbi:MAG: UDP-N-acetylmuramate dehydrogenase [Prevotella sp.]|uniref:UDP-N-acetylmuramate dehydrogenase n=1 Tax=Prevotella sp. TaxID=59823 RepID=UPI002A3085B9|nr:UDP-N-acetylmuramate dehydrogenase [Prevotella sp.]MDD7318697.1 UDP-N-acetylmuramate dehydrogenase [Prevotellaceae bacterium]MDY4019340.1 UDP-N-acetylmuramate dehydrogenase [Prevotella sp.]
MKDISDYSLFGHNTFGIDVRCSRFLEFGTVEEAQAVARELSSKPLPFLIIGGGSNLLLTQDFAGTVVHSAIKGISHEGNGILRCGSGEHWDDVVAYCVENNLYGAENLSLIPGDVGASAVQNIGAYGVEAKDLIESIEAVEIATAKVVTIDAGECRYAYRMSRFKEEWKDRYLITAVTYRLEAGRFEAKTEYGNINSELQRQGITNPTAGQLRQTVIDIRRQKLPDPEVEGNAGSFFMNPVVDRKKFDALASQYPGMPHYTLPDGREKIPAGWLIDRCGWKGRSLGKAGVHDKQALVLVNRGGATGSEIVALSDAIRKDVAEKFGIEIFPEVNILPTPKKD